MFWSPNSDSVSNIQGWWPGANYVDIVGLDVYPQPGATFASTYGPFYDAFATTYDKHFCIGETGAGNDAVADKEAWVKQLADTDVTLSSSSTVILAQGNLFAARLGLRLSRLGLGSDLNDDPPPVYRALSYVWGDPKLTAEISIEGTEGPTTIGLNLSLAIRYVRQDGDDVVLWADALCINQNDVQERSDQVRKMGTVYEGATEVIGWLGEEDDDTKLAMELVESWVTMTDMPNVFEGLPFGAATVERLQRLVPMAFDSRANSALLVLAKKRYWTRAWVYQELSLAKTVVIQSGRLSKTLDRFLKAAVGLQILFGCSLVADTITKDVYEATTHLLNSPWAYMLGLVGRSRGMRPYRMKTLPPEMLNRFKRLDSTDPRDKVFALLGFVALDGPYSELITPDYKKSTEQVYLDVTKYLILTKQTLQVLNERHLRLSTNCHLLLPTWVPDWQLATETESLYRLYRSKDKKAIIGSNLVSQLIRFLPSGELCLKGFEVDVISEVFNSGLSPLRHAIKRLDPIIEYQNFVKYCTRGPSVKTETPLSALFRLGIYNKLRNSKEPDPQGHRFIKSAVQFLKNIFQRIATVNGLPPVFPTTSIIPHFLVAAFLGEKAAQSEMERLLDLVLHDDLDLDIWNVTATYTTIGTVLFRTESGSLGMGPEGMARGDTLCHLAAHPEPFLLRPAGPRYTNVGDCDVLDLDLPEVVEELIPYMRDFEVE
ncbi:heterokaryon incompatibility protein-domain-containing protein [Usnea florida]